MPARDLRRAWAVGVVALVLLATAALRLRLIDIPLDRDEGEYAYFGQLLLQGVPPYAEAYNFKMPGIYVIYAAILAAFGQTPAAIHLGLIVVNALGTALLFLLALKLFDRLVACVAAAVFAVLTLSPRLLFTAAYAEHFVLPLVLAGALVLLYAIERPQTWALSLAGALLGAAFVVKQSGGAFCLFAIACVLVETRGPWRQRLGRALLVVGGALLPFAIVCLIMVSLGRFENFWFWTFTYAREYATATSVARGAVNLATALHWILPTSYLLAALSAVGVLALVVDPTLRARRRVVGAFLGASLLAASGGLYFRNQYFILLLPALAILAGLAVGSVARRTASARPRLLRTAIPLALAVVPVLHLVYLERGILFQGSPRAVARALYGLNPFPESLVVAQYIHDRTTPDDRIAVVASEPEIYFYAQRRAATGYIYTYALMEPQPYASAMQRQMMHEIESFDPRFLVFVAASASWVMRPTSDLTILRWFEHYRTRFDRVGVVEVRSLQETKYFWGPEAAAHAPTGRVWLEILERRSTTQDHGTERR